MESSKVQYQIPEHLVKYLGKGKTIYDIIDKYFNIGNYSLDNLLNVLRTIYDENNPNYQDIYELSGRVYKEYFKVLTDGLIDCLRMTGNPKYKNQVSKEEKQELLKKLRQVSENGPKFDTINEYIYYARENMFNDVYYSAMGTGKHSVNPELDEINKILLKAASEHASDETSNFIKYTLIKEIFCRHIKHYINQNTPYTSLRGNVKKPDPTKDPEWQEINNIMRDLREKNDLRAYDETLAEIKRKSEEFAERQVTKILCMSKRRKVVEDELEKTLIVNQARKLSTQSLDSVLFDSQDKPVPTESAFSWQVKEYKQPQIILDSTARYSPDGVENQRVIAISYGRFCFDTMFNPKGKPTISSDINEIIGVTRIGKDGPKSYIVIAPLFGRELKNINDILENDELASVPGIPRDIRIIDNYGLNQYRFVRKERIPPEQSDFYSKIVFSDEYLSDAIEKNYGYIGSVSEISDEHARSALYPNLTSSALKVDATYKVNGTSIDAVKHAMSFPGRINSYSCDSLYTYMNSNALLVKNLEIAKRYMSSKDKNEKDIREFDFDLDSD